MPKVLKIVITILNMVIMLTILVRFNLGFMRNTILLLIESHTLNIILNRTPRSEKAHG